MYCCCSSSSSLFSNKVIDTAAQSMSATSVIDSEVPLHVLVEHMPSVYSAQYKLSRCLLSLDRDQPSAADMRRLGSLRRSAQVTVRQLQQAIEAHHRKTAPVNNEVVEHATLSDEAQFFSQRMPDVCRTLEEGIRESGVLLEQHVTHVVGSPILPVSCVGARIESVPVVETASKADDTPHKLAIFHDPEVYAVQDEKATVERIANAVTASREKSTPVTRAQTTKAKSVPPPLSAPAHSAAALPGSTNAEDEVLDDIKNVIGQMKQGALQMNTLMQRDVEALRTSEKLLQDGLQRSKRNIDSMDKLTGDSSSAYSGKGNSLLSRIPGGAFIWRSFLLPLWEVIKQAFYMCCILAATAFVLFVMLMMPKPKTFARKEPKGSSLPTPAPVEPTVAPSTTSAPVESVVRVPAVKPKETLANEAASIPSENADAAKGAVEKEDGSASEYDDEEDEEYEEEEEPSNYTEEPPVKEGKDIPPPEEQIPAEMDDDDADL